MKIKTRTLANPEFTSFKVVWIKYGKSQWDYDIDNKIFKTEKEANDFVKKLHNEK